MLFLNDTGSEDLVIPGMHSFELMPGRHTNMLTIKQCRQTNGRGRTRAYTVNFQSGCLCQWLVVMWRKLCWRWRGEEYSVGPSLLPVVEKRRLQANVVKRSVGCPILCTCHTWYGCHTIAQYFPVPLATTLEHTAIHHSTYRDAVKPVFLSCCRAL